MKSLAENHINSEQPRVTPIPTDQIPDTCHAILEGLPGKGLKGRFAPKNVLGTLMHNTGQISTFLKYWVTSKQTARISPRMQELVILRIAVHYNSDYVWGHHIPPALEAGINRREIDRVTRLDDLSGWCDKETVLLKATDEMNVNLAVSDATYEDLSRHYDVYQILDFIHLVTQYHLFSLVNNTFRVALEPGIERIPKKMAVVD